MTVHSIHHHRQLTTRYEDGCIPPASEVLMTLVGQHAREVLADTEIMVKAAAARAREIPSVPELRREVDAAWTVIGELIMRVAVLEQAQAQRDRAGRRG